MRLERFRVKTPGMAALLARSLLCVTGLLLTLSPPVCEAFNLDVENPAVYSGPTGSYFGYAVDFYLADSSRWALIYLFFLFLTSRNRMKVGSSGIKTWNICLQCSMWGQICYVQTFHWFILQVFSFVPKLQDILQTRLLKSQLEFPFCCFGNAEIIRVVFVVLVVLVAALILNSGCCVHTVISGHMLYARRTRPQCAHNPV